MANVIKHKRGSGSDPAANNLVIGELAIRTDNGKLFTKMDSGAIAEIAGGGSDIAINTLSSSSATGGGSATFNGSAYRFTLSSPPSVSAAQLLVSVNGVIQKPVAGTGQPSEGFSVDGNDIIFGDAPATGADFFILTFRSLGVSEPADNSVTSAKIVDGTIVNADINASAAIAGSKISPNFGSQTIATTGVTNLTGELRANGNIRMTNASPKITFVDDDNNPDFEVGNLNGLFRIRDATNTTNRLVIDSSGKIGIGTTSPSTKLTVTDTGPAIVDIHHSDGGTGDEARIILGALSANPPSNRGAGIAAVNNGAGHDLTIKTSPSHSLSPTEKVRVTSGGNVGIGTTSPNRIIHAASTGHPYIKCESTNTTGAGIEVKDTAENWLIQADGGVGPGLAFYDLGRTSYRLIIDSSGNLAIKTNDVKLSGAGTLRINSGSTAGALNLDGGSSNHGGEINLTGGSNGGRIQFRTGQGAGQQTEKMRLDENGKLGIGTTSPVSPLHLHESSSGSIEGLKVTNTGTGAGLTDGLSIGLQSDEDVFIHNYENTAIHFGTNDTTRLSILAGGGLTFNGDTAAANALDDYEEGTWTPTLPSGASAGLSGQYTKIGNKVFWALQVTSLSGSASFQISGLPYTVGNGWGGNISISDNNHSPEHIYVFAHNGQTTVYFRNDTNGTFNTGTFSGHFFYCNGFYEAS